MEATITINRVTIKLEEMVVELVTILREIEACVAHSFP